MKKLIILLVLVISTASAHAQSLKDLLYGGKLKSDTGSVVRKTDDLASKIDTTTKKPPAPEKVVVTPGPVNTPATGAAIQPGAAIPGAPIATEVKDNNKVWKDYMDELTGILRTEVMTSKKIKEGIYSVLIDYQIGTDGQVTVNSVSSSPGNSFLEQQVKERITMTAPQLTPLLNTYGKPRVAAKKQTITLNK